MRTVQAHHEDCFAVADEKCEIPSRLQAGRLLWNKYAGHKVWEKEVDDGEYK